MKLSNILAVGATVATCATQAALGQQFPGLPSNGTSGQQQLPRAIPSPAAPGQSNLATGKHYSKSWAVSGKSKLKTAYPTEPTNRSRIPHSKQGKLSVSFSARTYNSADPARRVMVRSL